MHYSPFALPITKGVSTSRPEFTVDLRRSRVSGRLPGQWRKRPAKVQRPWCSMITWITISDYRIRSLSRVIWKDRGQGTGDRDLYQGVIGIDRTFFTNFYVNLQFFYDFIENGREAIALKRKTHGLTFEISDKFLDDDLMAGFRGMYFTSNEGSACEIFAEYKIGDDWQIAPGCMFFNGPKDSRLGQFDDNNIVYLRLTYSF